ncbi:glucose-6-phosphate isomerase [Nitrosopumilus ureiphilus]|uniref:Glucose-6-phosphate isomerase n=2 Tax=Nitrosopumilus ureiphilus TaxID=1470067 RepID=A0A7D5M6U7_9ARCH|nr:SIS domain-containing protein [Nitrosopumilus ureiphilus]QLH05808.1 glucose-6-phosphate isomerase [Nitrosopumilus ureiphilus]
MYAVYDRWSEIARESFESEQNMVNFDHINHIVFAGMGGSGTIGDIFSSILSRSKIHVNVVKGYVLPKTADSNTLVVSISVSGNTAETLSVLESAQKINCKTIAFSSGGRILDFCTKNKIQHRVVPQIHSPRASFVSYLYSILKVLHVTLGIKQEDILESIEELEKIGTRINSSNLTDSNMSLNLAKWITGIPMIYYPFGLQSTGIRFKNSLNENAKIHASAEDVIEACHNGVVSWEKKSNFQPILIEGQDDHIKTKERWQILKKLLQQNDIEYKEIISIKGGILSKLVNLIYLLDYTTIYLAIKLNTDPTPVKSIDFIKKNLKIEKI